MQTPRLTLRTLLAYLDDTLPAEQARALGKKVSESKEAQELIERIKRVTRRRRLTAPIATGDADDVSDPNTVAEYLSDNLKSAQVRELEETCLTSDVHLAEVAACHQILTLVLTEPVRVPPSANHRMYLLCDPPASDPSHKPSATLPVGGLAPRPDGSDADEPDAALLLGMKRYSASATWAGRVGLLAAVAVVAASLVIAVLMALPPKPGDRPEVSTTSIGTRVGGNGDHEAPPPRPIGDKPNGPSKKQTDEKPETGVGKQPEDPKKGKGEPKIDPVPKDQSVQPPVAGEEVVGELLSKDALVLTRSANGNDWLRVDPASPSIRSGFALMALPGFKADVKLGSQVLVHMWGNVPEQIAMPQMVMQSRVQFNTPSAGFDADITVVSGRVYVTTLKPTGSRIRLRLADEVWDVTVKNNGADVLARLHAVLIHNEFFTVFWDANRTDVLAQIHTAFKPGTPAREKPRTDATLAVVSGVAQIHAPLRFKTHDTVVMGQQLVWDSVSGKMSQPMPIPADLFPHIDPGLPPEIDRALGKVLADAAKSLTSADGIRIVLKERLTKPFPDDLKGPPSQLQAIALAFPTQWAVYSVASIMDGPGAEDLLKDLIDTLGDAARPYARQATVMALSAWVSQSPGNTDILLKGMVAKGWLNEDAELVTKLLRGYSSIELRDPTAVDELVSYLDHQQLAVRETALGNLFAFFDPDAVLNADLRIDVARRGEKVYDRFLNSWKTRALVIKQRIAEMK